MGTPQASDEPIERFSPSAGRWLGIFGVALMVIASVLVLIESRSHGTLTLVAGLGFLSMLLWAFMIAPTVHAYADHLMLRNGLTVSRIPWSLIKAAWASQTLQVKADDKVHHGIAIGKSARKMLADGDRKHHRTAGSGLGAPGFGEYASKPALEDAAATAMPYADFVALRIEFLANDRAEEEAGEQTVTTTRRWPEILGLTGFGVAFVVLIVL